MNLLVRIACLSVVLLAACSLNPQPEPPMNEGVPSASGGHGGSSPGQGGSGQGGSGQGGSQAKGGASGAAGGGEVLDSGSPEAGACPDCNCPCEDGGTGCFNNGADCGCEAGDSGEDVADDGTQDATEEATEQ